MANVGPQVKFPVPQGILDYNGTKCASLLDKSATYSFISSYNYSTVAIALWVLEANASISPVLSLIVDDFFDGGVGRIAMNNPHWSPRHLA